MKRDSRGVPVSISVRTLSVLALLFLSLAAVPAQAQLRVATYNVAQMRGEETALADVLAELSNDDHAGPAYPVSIIVFQEVTNSTFATLVSLLGSEYSAATYTNSNEDNFGGAQAAFYRADTVIEVLSGHDGTYTGAGRRARRWQFRLVGYSDPVVDFYVYSGHLKAGTTSDSEDERVFGMNNILNNATEIPAGSHVIFCGDFNFYSSNEPAYQVMLSHATITVIDPLGTSNWSGTSGASKHTQSPRTISEGGLASGGLDDRFDFHVTTDNMADGEGLAMIATTIRAVGNDENHYNEAINDGTNGYYPGEVDRSNDLADDLHDASDHLPVVADYMIPAVMDASMFNADFGTIITGGTVSLSVNVANECTPGYPGGGSDMAWYLDGTGTIEGVDGSGTLAAGENEWVPFEISPEAGGSVGGDLLIRSDGAFVQSEPVTIPVSGIVLRHSDASFTEETDIDWLVSTHVVQADSGLQTLEVPVWNFAWDSGQAALDLDAVNDVDPPFALVGGLVTGVTDSPAMLQFTIDTTGLPPGFVADAMQLLASDEDLNGATDQVLSLSLSVSVEDGPSGCEGDLDGSGQTDVEDLLIVLDSFGSLYSIDDLLMVIGDWDCVASG